MKPFHVAVLFAAVFLAVYSFVWADGGTEFPGTVLTIDSARGKFTVKKDSGGTRFSFVVNSKTIFRGTGLTSVNDLKKDDKVVVIYQVQGSQYLAVSVTR